MPFKQRSIKKPQRPAKSEIADFTKTLKTGLFFYVNMV
jgi:hypothetical protein